MPSPQDSKNIPPGSELGRDTNSITYQTAQRFNVPLKPSSIGVADETSDRKPEQADAVIQQKKRIKVFANSMIFLWCPPTAGLMKEQVAEGE